MSRVAEVEDEVCLVGASENSSTGDEALGRSFKPNEDNDEERNGLQTQINGKETRQGTLKLSEEDAARFHSLILPQLAKVEANPTPQNSRFH